MSHRHRIEDLGESARAFVINLDSRPDRMREFHRRFDRFDLPIERVSACTPETTREWFAEANPATTPTEIACAASHHGVFQRMIDESIPWALVIEDDAVPVLDLPRRIRWLFASWPEDCWCVQLGYVRSENMGLRGLVRALAAHVSPSANELRPDVRRLGNQLSIVTLDFAEYIVPLMRPDTRTIDIHLNALKDFDELGAHAYVHVPCLARQSLSSSDIQRNAHWAMERGQRWIP